MSEIQRRIHPLIATAAVAIIIFSAVGVGMMTGVIPGTSSKEAPPAAPTAVAEAPRPAPVSETVPAKEAAPAKEVAPQKERAPAKAPAPRTERKAPPAQQPQLAKAPEPVAKPVCNECGVVEAVNVVEKKGEGTGLGAVAGGVAGGLVGSQFGKGTGKTVATVAGAAGGAYAGHQVEKYVKSTKQWDIQVRMEDGSTRTLSQDTEPGFRAGDPVKVVEGKVLAR